MRTATDTTTDASNHLDEVQALFLNKVLFDDGNGIYEDVLTGARVDQLMLHARQCQRIAVDASNQRALEEQTRQLRDGRDLGIFETLKL